MTGARVTAQQFGQRRRTRLISRLSGPLAERRHEIAFEHAALRAIDGPAPERDVYALLPPGAHHPLARRALDALVATAAGLRCR